MNAQPFSNLEAAWWTVDAAHNRLHITALLLFDEPLDFATLRHQVAQRLLTVPRFRQRVRPAPSPLSVPHWIETDVDLDHQLKHIVPFAPVDDEGLRTVISAAIDSPLDQDRPLWHIHQIDKVNGGSALLVRVHHSLFNGPQALFRALSVLDERTPLRTIEHASRSGSRPPSISARVTQALRRPVQTMNQAAQAAAYLNSWVWLRPDRPTLLKGSPGEEKSAAWLPAYPLSQLQAVAYLTDSTVNDVLLAALAGAVRRYLADHQQPTAQLNLTALLTMSGSRTADHIGFGRVALPIGYERAEQRLVAIQRRMQRLKASPEAALAYELMSLTGGAPPEVARWWVKTFGGKATLVMSNVRGPAQHVCVGRQPAARAMFWVPAVGPLAVSVSVLSYAGAVTVGLNADARLLPDAPALLAGLRAELAEMLAWLD